MLQGMFEEIKAKLAEITITETGADGGITVIMHGNGRVQDILVTSELASDPERLSDELVATMNRAIQLTKEASSKAAKEVLGPMADMLGDLPDGLI